MTNREFKKADMTLPKAPGVDYFCIFLRKSVNLQTFDQLYDNVYVW